MKWQRTGGHRQPQILPAGQIERPAHRVGAASDSKTLQRCGCAPDEEPAKALFTPDSCSRTRP